MISSFPERRKSPAPLSSPVLRNIRMFWGKRKKHIVHNNFTIICAPSLRETLNQLSVKRHDVTIGIRGKNSSLLSLNLVQQKQKISVPMP